MNEFIKILPADLKVDMCFSAPVYFEDEKNMFLAAGKTVKNYHVNALKRWNIPFLVTRGHEIPKPEGENVAALAGFDRFALSDVDEVEELEELEEV